LSISVFSICCFNSSAIASEGNLCEVAKGVEEQWSSVVYQVAVVTLVLGFTTTTLSTWNKRTR
jgi:hypothetical protein